ncbi:MAG: NUDIX hydrolase [Candidatus Thorarchaeota archaeon]
MQLQMVFPNVRAIALCIIRNGPKFLVEYYEWPTPDDKFYRLLGGEIEYGEYGEDTVKREFREEIYAEITDIKYLGTLENIFEVNGVIGHEIVRIYEGAFTDESFYSSEVIEGIDGFESPRKVLAYWKTVEQIENEGLPLYPDRLIDFLVEIGWLKK